MCDNRRRTYCCVFGCLNNSSIPELSLFKLPIEQERFHVDVSATLYKHMTSTNPHWARVINYGSLPLTERRLVSQQWEHAVLNHKSTESAEEIEPIELRIKHLKRQIFEEIKGLGNKPPYESDQYKEMYDYVDNSNKPIVPISDDDERKLHERYKQPELKTTTTTTEKYVASSEKTEERGAQLRSKKQKKKNNIETFYRRMAFNPNERDRPQKWTHCLDLLSPFLNGFLRNVTDTKKVFATDHTVRRLKHLLTLDMTDASTDEIRSTLYEISNLQLRIFQWDTGALKAILNTLIENRPHDFKGLKYGLKNLFATWKLNTSNLTRVLTQSRIFRPPCIQITNYAGSTVTPKVIRYTKPKTEKQNICVYRNGEDDC